MKALALAVLLAAPTATDVGVADAYQNAVRTCLSTRAKVELAYGLRDRDLLARRIATLCGPGYVRAMVQRGLLTEKEATAAVDLFAYREAGAALRR